MIAWYTQHKSDFVALRDMALSDTGMVMVARDFAVPSQSGRPGIAPQRLDEYRRLLRILALASVRRCREPMLVFFDVSGDGRSTKGYMYATEPAAILRGPFVRDLNDWKPLDRPAGAKRHIEDNWYLYLERTR